MTATHVDHWAEGYRAALDGASYDANPYEGKQGATATQSAIVAYLES